MLLKGAFFHWCFYVLDAEGVETQRACDPGLNNTIVIDDTPVESAQKAKLDTEGTSYSPSQ